MDLILRTFYNLWDLFGTISLIFIITIISIFLFYTKSETFDIIDINWEIIDSDLHIKKRNMAII